MNVVITRVDLGTARAARRRAFCASVRRMSLAIWMRVSAIGAPSSSPCWSAVTNWATCSESLRLRSSSNAWRRLTPMSIWRRVMRSSSAQGPSYFSATRSSACRKPSPALTTTASTSRKSGRVRSMSVLAVAAPPDQMPRSVHQAAKASSSSGEHPAGRGAASPPRRSRRGSRRPRGGPRSGRRSDRRGCRPCRAGGAAGSTRARAHHAQHGGRVAHAEPVDQPSRPRWSGWRRPPARWRGRRGVSPRAR